MILRWFRKRPVRRFYVAGPYSHSTTQERAYNVCATREAMIEILRLGFAVFSPVNMTEGLEHIPGLTYDHFMDNDLEWLRLCDAIYFCPGWESSKGCQIERDAARKLGLLIFDSMEDVRALADA